MLEDVGSVPRSLESPELETILQITIIQISGTPAIRHY